jgi:hypothetical protein
MKGNIFQEGSARFKATIALNKKKVHQGYVSVYVKNVDLMSPGQQYKYMEHEGKNDKNRWIIIIRIIIIIIIISNES